MRRIMIAPLVAGMALAVLGSAAVANQINTGGRTGAYFGTFCPPLKALLDKAQFKYDCVTSAGSRENIKRVVAEPRQIGFSQMDVFALETQELGDPNLLVPIRSDIARECVFMVTRNKELDSFGRIAALASKLRFILPPRESGSAGTFAFLQQVDPEGLGQAGDVSFAASTDEAITKALSADDTVALFVQFPDPDNARFKAVAKAKGLFVSVIDRAILRQQVAGKKVYFAEETEIPNAKGGKLITACTPMVVFTGHPDRVEAGNARQDHKDLIQTVRDAKADALRPKVSWFKRIWSKTRQLSSKAIDKAVELSEKAREKAKPLLEKAKEKAEPYVERAREMGAKAMEKAGEVTERAKEEAKEMLEGAKERMNQ